MSERAKTTLELTGAMGLLILAMLCVAATPALAAMAGAKEAVEASQTLAGMKTEHLLALIAILSISLAAYLIHLLFSRLLHSLDAFTRSNAEVAKMLAERPCIRHPQNN